MQQIDVGCQTNIFSYRVSQLWEKGGGEGKDLKYMHQSISDILWLLKVVDSKIMQLLCAYENVHKKNFADYLVLNTCTSTTISFC